MSNAIPAIWSAVAATFAALSSLMIMVIQRRNLLELARPELVLTGWSRQAKGDGSDRDDVIRIKSIRNVGQGIALHVGLNCTRIEDDLPTIAMRTINIPVIARGETEDIDAQIQIWWKNIHKEPEQRPFTHVLIEIISFDARNMRHQTIYRLYLDHDLSSIKDSIAPGVMITERRSITVPIWRLKLANKWQLFLAKLKCVFLFVGCHELS